IFYLNRGNILAATNDDVLLTIAQLGIAIWMHHGQVTAVEPATTEGLSGGLGLGVISQHDVVAAHDDLAQSLRIGGHVLHVIIDHPPLFRNYVRDSFPGFLSGPPVGWPGSPLPLPRTQPFWAAGLFA